MKQHHVLLAICVSIVIICSLSACGKSEDEPRAIESSANATLETETTEVLTEETAAKDDTLSADDCQNLQGLFISCGDGRFIEYPVGGYCAGMEWGFKGFDGMFLADEIAYNIPVIDSSDEVALFLDGNYSLDVFPVIAEVAAIRLEKSDGTRGFGKLMSGGLDMIAYYRDNTVDNSIQFQTINGEAPSEYNCETVEWRSYPYPGAPSEDRYWKLCGFERGKDVTLGIAEGTKLVETTYSVDSTYYACNPDMIDWDQEAYYTPDVVPTVDGYAAIDFSKIPSGRYIIVYHDYENRTYTSTLPNWLNN